MMLRFKTLVTVGSVCAILLVGAGVLVQTGCGGGSGSAVVAPTTPPVADVTEIFVSLSGDDANAGTLLAPVHNMMLVSPATTAEQVARLVTHLDDVATALLG